MESPKIIQKKEKGEQRTDGRNQKQETRVDFNITLSTITNIDGLNTPIKQQKLSDCIKKHDPIICWLTQ